MGGAEGWSDTRSTIFENEVEIASDGSVRLILFCTIFARQVV